MSIRPISKFTLVILAGLLLAGAAGCTTRPTASITGMKIQGVSLTDATMLFDVKVDNPYMAPLPLGNLDYALASQGQQFMSGKSMMQGVIPANDSKTLGVPIKINFMKLMNAVKGVGPGDSVPYKADMGLSVDVPVMGALRVPMSQEGAIDIPSQASLKKKLFDTIKGQFE